MLSFIIFQYAFTCIPDFWRAPRIFDSRCSSAAAGRPSLRVPLVAGEKEAESLNFFLLGSVLSCH